MLIAQHDRFRYSIAQFRSILDILQYVSYGPFVASENIAVGLEGFIKISLVHRKWLAILKMSIGVFLKMPLARNRQQMNNNMKKISITG